MRILAVDVGLSLGWTVLEDGRYVSGGTRIVKEKPREHKGARWQRVSDGIDALLEETKPDIVAFEDVNRHKGVLAAHSFGFIKYSLLSRCANRSVPTHSLRVTEWKHIIGLKGNAKKPEVAAAMIKRYGAVEFDSEDHSDALGIATAAFVLGIHRRQESDDEDRIHGSGRSRKKQRADAAKGLVRSADPPITD